MNDHYIPDADDGAQDNEAEWEAWRAEQEALRESEDQSLKGK